VVKFARSRTALCPRTPYTSILQGGNELCRIYHFDLEKPVSELKMAIEAKAGLNAAWTRLIHEECGELRDTQTLRSADLQSEMTEIELFARTTQGVTVANELGSQPLDVTNDMLAQLCDRLKEDPPEVQSLAGCFRTTSLHCLAQLPTYRC
jgi:hypothetical protein